MEAQLAPAHEGQKRTLSNLVMDVVAPPPADDIAETGPEPLAAAPALSDEANPSLPLQKSSPKEAPTKPKLAGSISPKQSSSGVTAAIIATVIIVLGLALLAVVAFLKQK